MKKYVLILFIIFSSGVSKAQSYYFSQDTVTYSNLSSPTVVSTPGWDILNVYTIPFPFHFEYFGVSYDTFYVAGGFGGFVYYGASQFGPYEIYFYEARLIDRGFGLSTISYKTTGNAPNRILKLEVNNAGFEDDTSETDYVNVQLWFYETTNVIEIHIGPNSVLNPASWEFSTCLGPLVMLALDQTTFVQLTGQSSNPTSSIIYVSDCITDAPPVDKVYFFSPTATGIDEFANQSLEIYPNPCNGSFKIKSSVSPLSELNIFSITGQLVYTGNYESGEATINTELESGLYIVKLISGDKLFINKIIIE